MGPGQNDLLRENDFVSLPLSVLKLFMEKERIIYAIYLVLLEKVSQWLFLNLFSAVLFVVSIGNASDSSSHD